MIEGLPALYIFMLSAFTGYEVISRVPVILHTPLMSGSNFIHGIVVVGAMIVMGNAEGALELSIGFIAVAMEQVMLSAVTWQRCVCWRCSIRQSQPKTQLRERNNHEFAY